MKRVPRIAREDQMMEPWEVLAENRILHFIGPIVGMLYMDEECVGANNFSAENIAQSIIILDSINHEPIKLIIDSPGGFVKNGLNFYNIMQSVKSPVYTIGRFCASMAAILFASGAPGHRYLYPYARVMLHLPTGGFTGDPKQIERQVAEFQKDKETLVSLLIKHGVKKTREQIFEDIDRDFYLSNEGAISYGIADHIITPDIHQELFGNLVIPTLKTSGKK